MDSCYWFISTQTNKQTTVQGRIIVHLPANVYICTDLVFSLCAKQLCDVVVQNSIRKNSVKTLSLLELRKLSSFGWFEGSWFNSYDINTHTR